MDTIREAAQIKVDCTGLHSRMLVVRSGLPLSNGHDCATLASAGQRTMYRVPQYSARMSSSPSLLEDGVGDAYVYTRSPPHHSHILCSLYAWFHMAAVGPETSAILDSCADIQDISMQLSPSRDWSYPGIRFCAGVGDQAVHSTTLRRRGAELIGCCLHLNTTHAFLRPNRRCWLGWTLL